MAKRAAGKRKADRSTAANRRSALPLGNGTTFKRTDRFILLGLAVMTFGIYAQVIGHQFITLDDAMYIQENPMVNRGVTLAGLVWAFTTFHATNWHRSRAGEVRKISCQLISDAKRLALRISNPAGWQPASRVRQVA